MSLVVSRTAGVVPERTLSGAFSRRGAADAPLLYTGGGRTELHLQLLFDAPLRLRCRESPIASHRPASPTARHDRAVLYARRKCRRSAAPAFRALYLGKVLERARARRGGERTPGALLARQQPQRSWMTMRFLRALDTATGERRAIPASALDTSNAGRERARDRIVASAADPAAVHPGERLDQLASRYLVIRRSGACSPNTTTSPIRTRFRRYDAEEPPAASAP